MKQQIANFGCINHCCIIMHAKLIPNYMTCEGASNPRKRMTEVSKCFTENPL